jgi:hypothetical protein
MQRPMSSARIKIREQNEHFMIYQLIFRFDDSNCDLDM